MPSTATDRLYGLTTSVAVKAPCRLKTTANHALSGLAAIDGVTPVARDRILVGSQTNATENGIWIAQSGAWSRAADFNGSLDAVGGTLLLVTSGTASAGSYWRIDGDGEVIIGTDTISIVASATDLLASPTWVAVDAATKTVDVAFAVIRTSGYSVAGDGGDGLYKRVTAQPTHQARFRTADRFLPNGSTDAANGGWWELVAEGGSANVHQLGAAGNGSTDDYAAIAATRDFVKAVGAGRVAFTQGKTYRTSTWIKCGSNIAWDFNRAKLACSQQIVVFGCDYAAGDKVADITADIIGPTNLLSVSSVASLAVGDYIMFRAGHNPWDNNEPLFATTARITAINALVLTLDCLITKNITFAAYTYYEEDGTTTAVPVVNTGSGGQNNRAVFKVGTNGINVEINDMDFLGDTAANQSVEGVLWFQTGMNITINRPRGNVDGAGDAGTGLVGLMQFCRNVVVSNPMLMANKNGRGQASLGRMFNFSNCINVLVTFPIARGLQGNFAGLESFCENITFENPVIDILENSQAAAAVFFVGQGSSCKIINPTINNRGTVTWNFSDTGGTDGSITINGVVTIRGRMPLGLFVNEGMMLDYDCPAAASFSGTIAATTLTATGVTGELISLGAEVRGVGVAANTTVTALGTGTGLDGTYTVSVSQTIGPVTMVTREFAVVDYRAPRTVNDRIALKASMSEQFNLEGPVFAVTGYASANANLANVTGYYIGHDGIQNGNNLMSNLTAGKVVHLASRDAIGLNYGSLRQFSGKGYALISHNSTAPAAGSFLGVSAKVATVIKSSFLNAPPTIKNPLGVSYSDNFMSESLTGRKVETFEGSATFDPPSVAASGTTTTTVTVTGAASGDRVDLSFSLALGGLMLNGEVTSANTVTARFFNPTAGAIDLASGTLRAWTTTA